MINKKLLVVAVFASALSTSSAFAKTEGNYVGFNAIRAMSSYKHDGVKLNKTNASDSNVIGAGIDYKYAINFGGVFVAPVVFAESLNSSAHSSKKDTDTLQTKYRYGIKANVGYDITDNISTYLVVGAARNHFVSIDTPENSVNPDIAKTNKIGFLYGLGASYNLTKDVALNLEYNRQSATFKFRGDTTKRKAAIQVAQIGLAYHF